MEFIQSKRFFRNIILSLICCITLQINNLNSQSISTFGEIYDYDIGDVFHYYIMYSDAMGTGTIGYKNMVVTGKYYSFNNDTIFYVIDVAKQEKYSENPYWTYDYYTDTIFYTFLNSLIHSQAITFSDSSLYHGRTINSVIYGNGYETYHLEWVHGCGQVLYVYILYHGGYEEELVYYKKGIEVWGIPVYVYIDKSEEIKLDVSLYPNPAKNFIILETPLLENAFAEIQTIKGQKIKHFELCSERTRIDISYLNKGIYILILNNDVNQVYRKFIKE